MVKKGLPTRLKPVRLQTVDRLRIRRPNSQESNPCLGALTAVLNCWATAGYNIQGCMELEQQLRSCADENKQLKTKKSTINYHLSRMWPKMSGPRKKD